MPKRPVSVRFRAAIRIAAQVFAKVKKYGNQGSKMKGDIECQAWVSPSEKPWRQDEMS